MSTLASDPLCKKLRFDADTMWVELTDGRQLGVPLSYFPRLLHATPAQREQYTISGGGLGLHWEELDEDISVRGLLLGKGDNPVRSRQA
jgi:hypothetical protein